MSPGAIHKSRKTNLRPRSTWHVSLPCLFSSRLISSALSYVQLQLNSCALYSELYRFAPGKQCIETLFCPCLNNIDESAHLATFPLKNTIASASIDTLKTAVHIYLLLFRQVSVRLTQKYNCPNTVLWAFGKYSSIVFHSASYS